MLQGMIAMVVPALYSLRAVVLLIFSMFLFPLQLMSYFTIEFDFCQQANLDVLHLRYEQRKKGLAPLNQTLIFIRSAVMSVVSPARLTA